MTTMLFHKANVLPLHQPSYYGPSLRLLGEGGFGYVSEHKVGTRRYAIKYYNNEPSDVTIRGDLLREVGIMMRCEMPYILPILDVIRQSLSEESPYGLVLPIASMSLGDVIENDVLKGDFSLQRRIAYRVTVAVAYLHSQDIIHRDIKPDNILYYDDGTVQLADFGMSVALGCSNEHGWLNVAYSGLWRAPELILDQTFKEKYVVTSSRYHYSYEADIWALGATLYEIFAGDSLVNYDQAADRYNSRIPSTIRGGERHLVIALLSIFDTMGWPSTNLFSGTRNWQQWDLSRFSRLSNLSPLPATENNLNRVPPEVKQLIETICVLNPRLRPNAAQIRSLPFFEMEEQNSGNLPVYPSRRCDRALKINEEVVSAAYDADQLAKRREVLLKTLSLELIYYPIFHPGSTEAEAFSRALRIFQHSVWIFDKVISRANSLREDTDQYEEIALASLYIAEKYELGGDPYDERFLQGIQPSNRFVFNEEEILIGQDEQIPSPATPIRSQIKTDKYALARYEALVLDMVQYDFVRTVAIDYLPLTTLLDNRLTVALALSALTTIYAPSSQGAQKDSELIDLLVTAAVVAVFTRHLTPDERAATLELLKWIESEMGALEVLIEEMGDADLQELIDRLLDLLRG